MDHDAPAAATETTSVSADVDAQAVGDSFDLESPAFASDEFRVYMFKIKRCPRCSPHDWTEVSPGNLHD
jgi:hypothetical protein